MYNLKDFARAILLTAVIKVLSLTAILTALALWLLLRFDEATKDDLEEKR